MQAHQSYDQTAHISLQDTKLSKSSEEIQPSAPTLALTARKPQIVTQELPVKWRSFRTAPRRAFPPEPASRRLGEAVFTDHSQEALATNTEKNRYLITT